MLKLKTTKPAETQSQSFIEPVILQGIIGLARRLYPHNSVKRQQSQARLVDYYQKAKDKDILVIHSPGGWGNTEWEGIQGWEKSIVTGVTLTLEKLGYNSIVVQYFRSGNGFIKHMRDLSKEIRFFYTGANYRADVMSEEIKFIARILPMVKIVLVGASQGAAFDNAAMMRLGETEQVYSIELGTFFPHMKRRRLTARTLAIDNNGILPDPMCQRDLWAGYKAYVNAFYHWFQYKIMGKKVKFTNCINTPGHEYKWEYKAVNIPITDFLTAKLGVKRSS